MDEGRSGQLLTLRDAAKRLSVHPATLRRWADHGDILVMVTPGGHRRFPVTEIDRLAGESAIDESADEVGANLVEVAMTRAREDIAQHPHQAWMTDMSDAQRNHMRKMGRRVMSILEQFLSTDDGSALIEEAESMGREYAHNTKEMGLGLHEVLRAVTFFRDSILDAAVSMPEAAPMDREARRQLIRRINTFLSTILLSVAADFDH